MDEATRARCLLEAQAKAVTLFAAIEREGVIRPGTTDKTASREITQLAADLLGVEKHWHKRIVRSGPNTLRPYADNPPDRTMTADDIAFADLGPIFDGWEADFGRTWVLGDDPVKQRLRDDLEVVFLTAKQHFADRPGITGEELYARMVELTEERGWTYGNWHCGHLVGQFPHEDLAGEPIESRIAAGNTTPMRRVDRSGQQGHWILEVHLTDPEREIGGFYEELLTL